jgi:protein-arginine kinase activator protein McsA
MRCELCKKRKATIHLTQNPMPEEAIRVDLCAKCVRDRGYDENDLSRMFELLDSKIRGNSN